jgi:hypothetical protein
VIKAVYDELDRMLSEVRKRSVACSAMGGSDGHWLVGSGAAAGVVAGESIR